MALGTPRSTDKADVRSYLKEFLGDPLVIQKPRWLWLPILNGIILKVRPQKSAALYKRIWTKEGSPLMKYTIAQSKQLQALCEEADVRFAMTYGEPRLSETIKEMREAGVEKLNALPLYPQYSQTTVEPIVQQLKAIDSKVKVMPAFYDHPDYIRLLTQSVKEKWDKRVYDKLIFSYHGIPLSYVTKGKDPYEEQCQTITRLVTEKLRLDKSQYEHVYQSKFGTDKWLGPSMLKRMEDLPKEGRKKILVCSPSFVADCLETLYELEIENRNVFLKNSGEVFDFVHPFNDSSDFTLFLRQLVTESFGD